MPLIRVQTSVAAPDKTTVNNLLTTLSADLAQQLGKPESYVMTAFEPETPMTFGGSTDPACFIEIKSVGTMGSAKTQTMSDAFCQIIEDRLGIPKNRTYIEFMDAKGAMWGWNGRTF
ncbi:MAG: hypothetical protein F6K09_10340 [Merismopedia sp. SIO2A8]|nr:hypothetical protein [Symploca sp. SIO2B6]NET49103.1 hypothetical protein [Merismopedia sp. SIO2A8]